MKLRNHYAARLALVAGALVAGAVALGKPGPDSSDRPAPVLVGYGCEGASAPLYAASESDFPPCGVIRPRSAASDPFARVYSARVIYRDGESDWIARDTLAACKAAFAPHETARADWQRIEFCAAESVA